jgi:hypothetical protein
VTGQETISIEDFPVFLVGASRSGTAMLRSCLNHHSTIYLASETHYFDDLRNRKGIKGEAALSPAAQNESADYFRALDDRPYGMKGDPDQSPLSRDTLIAASRAYGQDADAVFEAYCRQIASREDAQIWGEKTPRHVFHIDTIRARFPHARIICMVRDPRAVVASYRDWKNRGGLKRAIDNEDYQNAIREEEQRAKLSYNVIISTLLWKAAAKASVLGRKKHGDAFVKVVRYEDVVSNPEVALKDICAWLGVAYEPGVLDIPMLNSSFSQFSDKAGISSEAAERWKTTLSNREIGIIQSVAGHTLKDAGYGKFDHGTSFLAVWLEWLKLPVAVVRAVLANRDRMGNIFTYTWQRLRAVVGV